MIRHGYGGSQEPRSPENAIAARNDLIPKDSRVSAQAKLRGPHGNTDAKIVSRQDVFQMQFGFVVGPTADDQPPFAWADEWGSLPHEGQPTVFNFSWHLVNFSHMESFQPAAMADAMRGPNETVLVV